MFGYVKVQDTITQHDEQKKKWIHKNDRLHWQIPFKITDLTHVSITKIPERLMASFIGIHYVAKQKLQNSKPSLFFTKYFFFHQNWIWIDYKFISLLMEFYWTPIEIQGWKVYAPENVINPWWEWEN